MGRMQRDLPISTFCTGSTGKPACFPHTRRKQAAISQAPGTGISLPVPSALPWFPAPSQCACPAPHPLCPTGLAGACPVAAPPGRKHPWPKAVCRESLEGAVQREEEPRMGGTSSGRNTQWHDGAWSSVVAGSGARHSLPIPVGQAGGRRWSSTVGAGRVHLNGLLNVGTASLK